MTLELRNVGWSVGFRKIVREVSLRVEPGEFLGVIGPNGSGKTSMMSVLAGIRAPSDGVALLDDQPMGKVGRRNLARRIGFVEQQADTIDRITVREAVSLGRTPYLSLLSPWSGMDDEIVANALESVAMGGMADRIWHTLSGGEKQRVHIARALAQQPDYLLLDEPTNHLDIRHQLGLLELVHDLPVTVVAALHDLNHAALFCDRIAMMDGGRLIAIGTPADILTSKNLRDVFGVEADVETASNGRCHIRYRVGGALDMDVETKKGRVA
ncbi:ABC transporter ATP-binding protein [Thalassospira sp.]|uniref:ABC transporter ATP-binding protein n=1 Tax=Thalassospira sp. TaxID=1912094 RepID=UPI000C663E52|nr:ABC transporter ATP-binding protein [Thalassospira sp.]MBC05986.1 histidinol phosphatase [Thalassospira sp.]